MPSGLSAPESDRQPFATEEYVMIHVMRKNQHLFHKFGLGKFSRGTFTLEHKNRLGQTPDAPHVCSVIRMCGQSELLLDALLKDDQHRQNTMSTAAASCKPLTRKPLTLHTFPIQDACLSKAQTLDKLAQVVATA